MRWTADLVTRCSMHIGGASWQKLKTFALHVLDSVLCAYVNAINHRAIEVHLYYEDLRCFRFPPYYG